MSDHSLPLSDQHGERLRVRRPLAITLLAWLCILNTIRHTGLAVTSDWISTGAKIETMITGGLLLLVGIGLLGMRKWAVVLYFTLYSINMLRIAPLIRDTETLLGLLRSYALLPLVIVPVATIVLVVPYWRRMRWF